VGGCCYIWCCPCCAAGDVATAAGGNYLMSCGVIPFCCGCLTPCWWANDRHELAHKLNVEDTISWPLVRG
jgi:hypothetical protein